VDTQKGQGQEQGQRQGQGQGQGKVKGKRKGRDSKHRVGVCDVNEQWIFDAHDEFDMCNTRVLLSLLCWNVCVCVCVCVRVGVFSCAFSLMAGPFGHNLCGRA
jgi:hypothetical protein